MRFFERALPLHYEGPKVPLSRWDILFAFVGGLLVLIGIGWVAIRYDSMPAQIPTHFGVHGIDEWGDKKEIWYMAFLDVVLYLFLVAGNIWPNLFKIRAWMLKHHTLEDVVRYQRLCCNVMTVVLGSLMLYIFSLGIHGTTPNSLFVAAIVVGAFLPFVAVMIRLKLP